MEHGSVTATLLGGVERLVGRSQKRASRLAMLWVACQPQADRDGPRVPGDLLGQPAAQALGDDIRVVVTGVGQYQRELLTAHPRDPVELALAVFEHAGEP